VFNFSLSFKDLILFSHSYFVKFDSIKFIMFRYKIFVFVEIFVQLFNTDIRIDG